MRKINKNIVLLSIILAAVLLSNSNIAHASSIRRGYVNKNQTLIDTNKTAIEDSLKNNDYNLFVNTLKGLGINEVVTTDQFSVLVKSYNLFKQGNKDEAIKILQDNKVNPILIKFINNRPDLTVAQKDILKQASDLIKQGKIDEAKALIKTAGLPEMPLGISQKIVKVENKANKEEWKNAFDQARELKRQGKVDEAKKVLKDAGVPDQIQDKIRLEFEKNSPAGFFQSLKNLFIK
jgi:lipopolysaccharide biosynthesis regulator YciM